MNDYLTQPNTPIVFIDMDKNGKFKFTQKENRRNVPLFLNEKQVLWLLKNGSVCSSESFNFDQQVLPIFNYKSYSFAALQYSLSYWNRLFKADLTKIDEVTLLGLVQDLKHQIKVQK